MARTSRRAGAEAGAEICLLSLIAPCHLMYCYCHMSHYVLLLPRAVAASQVMMYCYCHMSHDVLLLPRAVAASRVMTYLCAQHAT